MCTNKCIPNWQLFLKLCKFHSSYLKLHIIIIIIIIIIITPWSGTLIEKLLVSPLQEIHRIL
jgi:hypothetical protein